MLYEIDILVRGVKEFVYKTKNADTVIKIALNNEQPITNEKEIKAFHQKIKKLIYKPIPNDINIAKPLAVLQNEAGYAYESFRWNVSICRVTSTRIIKRKSS